MPSAARVFDVKMGGDVRLYVSVGNDRGVGEEIFIQPDSPFASLSVVAGDN